MRTASGLAALPVSSLLRSCGVFHACSSEWLVSAVGAAISRALSRPEGPSRGHLAVLAGARATVFRQFVAGEELRDVVGVARQLSACGVRCIVDHSTEELEDAASRRRNLQSKLTLLRKLSSELSTACAFVPVKMRSLVAPALLEQVTLGAASARERRP